MSRAQGDNFKTWTNKSLNEYKYRLLDKINKLADRHEKWYRCGNGWIHVEEENRMENPNGTYKWNGWIVEAHEYWVTVYHAENVKLVNGQPKVVGVAVMRELIENDREKANKVFKVAQELARSLKPTAKVTMNWDGDTYYYTLYIDGEPKLNAYNRSECVEAAKAAGFEI